MRWADGFIAVDWGTTNRRAYLIDSSGKQVDEFEDHKGVLSVGDGGFPAAIAEIRQRLRDLPLLLAGMIGSNRGWKEAPYVQCPAGLDELAKALVWAGKREAIVPGVSYLGNGRADVFDQTGDANVVSKPQILDGGLDACTLGAVTNQEALDAHSLAP